MAAKQPREGAICARYQALKRIGQPEDVVDVVVSSRPTALVGSTG
jgi:hypothetical protein